MSKLPKRVRRLRKLHALLRSLGIDREAFKRRMGVETMDEWTDRGLLSKIRYLIWVGGQPWPIRHAHGAMR